MWPPCLWAGRSQWQLQLTLGVGETPSLTVYILRAKGLVVHSSGVLHWSRVSSNIFLFDWPTSQRGKSPICIGLDQGWRWPRLEVYTPTEKQATDLADHSIKSIFLVSHGQQTSYVVGRLHFLSPDDVIWKSSSAPSRSMTWANSWTGFCVVSPSLREWCWLCGYPLALNRMTHTKTQQHCVTEAYWLLWILFTHSCRPEKSVGERDCLLHWCTPSMTKYLPCIWEKIQLIIPNAPSHVFGGTLFKEIDLSESETFSKSQNISL